MYEFIKTLLTHKIQFIHDLMFEAIKSLKCALNSFYRNSSVSWFKSWWWTNNFYKIKIKSIAVVKYTTTQKHDVTSWFSDYRQILQTLKITDRKNIINFDKAEFRVKCLKRYDIFVSIDVRKYYSLNSENKRFIIVIKMINVVDDYFTLSMLIIQDQQIMKFWYQDKLSKVTLCIFSKSEFTSDLIALQFLQHYVENSISDSLRSWKLMLMNNHNNHMTSEFIKLTNDNHIRSFSLISHLIHCMQFLDVEIFQSYKHWHDIAIQKAFEEFNIEYSFFRFCHDFIKIRNNIFKSKIIRNAFRKSEMWSIDVSLCIDQLKKFKTFNNNESIRMRRSEQMIEQRNEQMRNEMWNATATQNQTHESTLSLSSQIRSLTIDDVQNELLEWLSKIQNITSWNDSARSNEFAEFVENAKEIMAKSLL